MLPFHRFLLISISSTDCRLGRRLQESTLRTQKIEGACYNTIPCHFHEQQKRDLVLCIMRHGYLFFSLLSFSSVLSLLHWYLSIHNWYLIHPSLILVVHSAPSCPILVYLTHLLRHALPYLGLPLAHLPFVLICSTTSLPLIPTIPSFYTSLRRLSSWYITSIQLALTHSKSLHLGSFPISIHPFILCCL